MSAQLLPCPFCGQAQPVPCFFGIEGGYTDKWAGIECSSCGARGPDVRTGYKLHGPWRERAVEEWNRRVTQGEVIRAIKEWNRRAKQAEVVELRQRQTAARTDDGGDAA